MLLAWPQPACDPHLKGKLGPSDRRGVAGEDTKWTVRPPDELAWRELANEVVILDLRTSKYLTLNGSAAVLWAALAEGGATAGQLCECLQARYGLSTDRAAQDVGRFLAECQRQKLVQPAAEQSSPAAR